MNKLTERETQILYYIAKGYYNTEIGDVLHISRHTVKAHVSVIIEKLGCKNRSEIAYFAGKNNMF